MRGGGVLDFAAVVEKSEVSCRVIGMEGQGLMELSFETPVAAIIFPLHVKGSKETQRPQQAFRREDKQKSCSARRKTLLLSNCQALLSRISVHRHAPQQQASTPHLGSTT